MRLLSPAIVQSQPFGEGVKSKTGTAAEDCVRFGTVPGETVSLLPAGKKFCFVWNDEFNGDGLDESKWSYRTNFWGRRAPWFAAPEAAAVMVKDDKVHLYDEGLFSDCM